MRACEAVRVREGGVPQRWRLEQEEIRLRRGVVPWRVCCHMHGFQGIFLKDGRQYVGFMKNTEYRITLHGF